MTWDDMKRRRRNRKNPAAPLDAGTDAPMLPASPKSQPPPQEEDAAMAMTNAERQQRYRDRVKRDRADAVTRAIVTMPPRNVTPTDAAPQTTREVVSEVASHSPAEAPRFADRDPEADHRRPIPKIQPP